MTTAKINLLDYDRNGLREAFAALGEKPYRAEQVMKWIYHRHVTDFASMTDLGKALREKLENAAEIVPPKTLFETQASDATYKWLLGMDGSNAIEAVFIPETSRGTLCVSSQVGCGLNCQFCSTGTQGFNRNLSSGEIIGQVFVAAKHLGNVPHHQRKLTNVVMMGMGEPLLNFDNVVKAMSVMRDDLGFGLANKRVTLSTAGLVPKASIRASAVWRVRTAGEQSTRFGSHPFAFSVSPMRTASARPRSVSARSRSRVCGPAGSVLACRIRMSSSMPRALRPPDKKSVRRIIPRTLEACHRLVAS